MKSDLDKYALGLCNGMHVAYLIPVNLRGR